jgi:hypothetical protein
MKMKIYKLVVWPDRIPLLDPRLQWPTSAGVLLLHVAVFEAVKSRPKSGLLVLFRPDRSWNEILRCEVWEPDGGLRLEGKKTLYHQTERGVSENNLTTVHLTSLYYIFKPIWSMRIEKQITLYSLHWQYIHAVSLVCKLL